MISSLATYLVCMFLAANFITLIWFINTYNRSTQFSIDLTEVSEDAEG